MLTHYFEKLFANNFLTQKECENAMSLVLEKANSEQTSAFLTLLKSHGENVEEIIGIIKALMKNCNTIDFSKPVLDIVGTGGDFANTVNISTGAAILSAACGVPIAKHGNRSVSSLCGSADVLESLGIDISASEEQLKKCLEDLSITFLFAQKFHSGFQKLRSIRSKLKFPTVFNLVGPLLSPARAPFTLIGVAKKEHVDLFSQLVQKLPHIKRALIFHGSGLDEITTIGPVQVCEVHEGIVQKYILDPQALGFRQASLEELQGGDLKKNKEILERAFKGEESAVADTLILNAAVALYVFGKTASIQEGISFAKEVHRQGKAAILLRKWKKTFKALGEEI